MVISNSVSGRAVDPKESKTSNSLMIKVCGICSVEDALSAVAAGADLLGLIFAAGSARQIDEKTAREICAAVRGRVQTVGVFQNEDSQTVRRVSKVLGLHYVQLHGKESAGFCSLMSVPVIKAVTPDSIMELDRLEQYLSHISYFLIDRQKSIEHTSYMHIDLLVPVLRRLQAKYFLAGGLNANTVADVVQTHAPAGIDVASGVEVHPRVKSAGMMQHFIAFARSAGQEIQAKHILEM